VTAPGPAGGRPGTARVATRLIDLRVTVLVVATIVVWALAQAVLGERAGSGVAVLFGGLCALVLLQPRITGDRIDDVALVGVPTLLLAVCFL
jgi:hypothetical protein